MADDDRIALPILAHPSFLSSFVASPQSGLSHYVLFGQLMRLAGADWLEVSFEVQRLDWRYLPAGIVSLWVLSSIAAFEPARRPPAVATRSV